MKSKKGQMSGAVATLLALGIGVMVLAIALGYGQEIVGDIKDDFGAEGCSARSDSYTSYNTTSKVCYNSSGNTAVVDTQEFNASVDGQTAMEDVAEKTPTVAKVGVAVIIIGMIVGGFGVYFRGRF